MVERQCFFSVCLVRLANVPEIYYACVTQDAFLCLRLYGKYSHNTEREQCPSHSSPGVQAGGSAQASTRWSNRLGVSGMWVIICNGQICGDHVFRTPNWSQDLAWGRVCSSSDYFKLEAFWEPYGIWLFWIRGFRNEEIVTAANFYNCS